jgi:hypothetical protein
MTSRVLSHRLPTWIGPGVIISSFLIPATFAEPCSMSVKATSELERLAGNARHERPNQPSESERDATRERDGFALNVGSVVTLQKPPVRVQPPQKAPPWPTGLARSCRVPGSSTSLPAGCRCGSELDRVPVSKTALRSRCRDNRDDLLHGERRSTRKTSASRDTSFDRATAGR